jgi:hypothetical protein
MAVLIWLTGSAVCPAFGEPAQYFILQAFRAEEQAPNKRAELKFRRGQTETHYLIERDIPDKLHMELREGDRDQELYVVGDRMYQKSPTGWIVSQAGPALSSPISVVGLLKDRLENIKELAPVVVDGLEERVFEGTISWFSGRHQNAGEIRIFIETGSTLPRLMTFKGSCGSSECSFEHAMTYHPTIEIVPPIP